MRKRMKHKLPKVGTVFVRVYKARGEKVAKKLELKVIKTEHGRGYEFEGAVYRTPTAAAKSLVRYEVDGWNFWKMK